LPIGKLAAIISVPRVATTETTGEKYVFFIIIF